MKKLIIIIFIFILFSGCDKGKYFDVGPILVDEDLLPENIDKHKDKLK